MLSSRNAAGGRYQCRLRETDWVDSQERTALVLCLDGEHQRLLQEQLGHVLDTCFCPLQVLSSLERDPSCVVLVDRCAASYMCCYQPLARLQRSIRRAVHGLARDSTILSGCHKRSWGRSPANVTERIREACDHLQKSSRRVTLGSLAGTLGVSPRHLNRLCQASGVPSPMRAFQRERLRHAMLVIRARSRSIEEIAEDCGYSDRSSFCRAFRRTFGYSPGKMKLGEF